MRPEVIADKSDRGLGGAAALLFPVDWPEPFGLVTIEAMACGTPVIAFRRGSVPEIVADGVSGFIVETVEQAVAAVRRIATLNRAKIRAEFERRFTAERMAHGYLKIYQHLAATRTKSAMVRGLKTKKAKERYPLQIASQKSTEHLAGVIERVPS
jgi:glycosyltransferase involved in cell wall biosynthesis